MGDVVEWAIGEDSLAKGAYDWTFGEGSAINEAWRGVTGETAAEAAEEAAQAQVTGYEKGIEEQRRQFDITTELLSDYVGIGRDALSNYRALAGLGTPEEQQEAIEMIRQGDEYRMLTEEAEEGILAGASATGGLRGSDTQRFLAESRPRVLSDLINQQLGRFGSLATMGQQSATQTGAAGMGMAGNIASLYGGIGSARAGEALAKGQAAMMLPNLAMKGIGTGIGFMAGGPAGAAQGYQMAGGGF